jgi:hypothetical protein
MPADSADRDLIREAIAREQLEHTMQSELLRMPRRRLAADNHLSLDLFDDQVADPSMGRLTNLAFYSRRQARSGFEIV